MKTFPYYSVRVWTWNENTGDYDPLHTTYKTYAAALAAFNRERVTSDTPQIDLYEDLDQDTTRRLMYKDDLGLTEGE